MDSDLSRVKPLSDFGLYAVLAPMSEGHARTPSAASFESALVESWVTKSSKSSDCAKPYLIENIPALFLNKPFALRRGLCKHSEGPLLPSSSLRAREDGW